jgi:hypothetical protein
MDGEPPQEEDFSQIPIVERSQHKVISLTASSGAVAYLAELESSSVSIQRCDRKISKDSFRHRPILPAFRFRWRTVVSTLLPMKKTSNVKQKEVESGCERSCSGEGNRSCASYCTI